MAGGLPLAQNLYAVPASSREQAGQTLRKKLHGCRAKIETLHVEYTYQSTASDDLRNGRNHFFMSQSRFHARVERPEGTLVQILDDEFGLDAFTAPDGVVQYVRILETSARKRPPRPLDNFLPQLEDEPMTGRGFRDIDGERCQGVLQGDRLLWISPNRNAVCSVEIFRTTDQIEERMSFKDFEELAPGLFFPRSIQVLIYGEQGDVVVERNLTVHSVILNQLLPEHLFSVRDFPAKGKKVSF